MISLEVCANSLASALAAQEGGASRVEFCDNLADGGTTPGPGQLALARRKLQIGLWPIIRPRGGDFLYTDLEFEIMKADISYCKQISCDGIVIGLLDQKGKIDRERCAQLIDIAGDMPVAFHRAFDMTANMEEALETLIDLGVVRVLTSGGSRTAAEGIVVIKELISQSSNRIEIMPGAGVSPDNVALLRDAGARTIHASCKEKVESLMEYRNLNALMGSASDEYSYEQTSVRKVKELLAAANTSAN